MSKRTAKKRTKSEETIPVYIAIEYTGEGESGEPTILGVSKKKEVVEKLDDGNRECFEVLCTLATLYSTTKKVAIVLLYTENGDISDKRVFDAKYPMSEIEEEVMNSAFDDYYDNVYHEDEESDSESEGTDKKRKKKGFKKLARNHFDANNSILSGVFEIIN